MIKLSAVVQHPTHSVDRIVMDRVYDCTFRTVNSLSGVDIGPRFDQSLKNSDVIAVEMPMEGGMVMPESVICSDRGTPNCRIPPFTFPERPSACSTCF